MADLDTLTFFWVRRKTMCLMMLQEGGDESWGNLFCGLPWQPISPRHLQGLKCHHLPRLHVLGLCTSSERWGQPAGMGGKTLQVLADTDCLLLLSATTEGSLQNAATSTMWQIQLNDVLLASYFPDLLQ